MLERDIHHLLLPVEELKPKRERDLPRIAAVRLAPRSRGRPTRRRGHPVPPRSPLPARGDATPPGRDATRAPTQPPHDHPVPHPDAAPAPKSTQRESTHATAPEGPPARPEPPQRRSQRVPWQTPA